MMNAQPIETIVKEFNVHAAVGKVARVFWACRWTVLPKTPNGEENRHP